MKFNYLIITSIQLIEMYFGNLTKTKQNLNDQCI